jgi:hypothetical protein
MGRRMKAIAVETTNCKAILVGCSVATLLIFVVLVARNVVFDQGVKIDHVPRKIEISEPRQQTVFEVVRNGHAFIFFKKKASDNMFNSPAPFSSCNTPSAAL